MNILISNDDGIHAQGIKALESKISTLGKTFVVAPDRNCSGAATSLSIDKPLRIHQFNDNHIAVEGTPTDCVHLATTGILPTPPDIVISGINKGSNLSDDVWYSGTVAAAREGRNLGLTAMAFSLCTEGATQYHFDAASEVAYELVKHQITHGLPKGMLLNINIPNCPIDEIQGYHITRLGARHKPGQAIVDTDPRGRALYWIGKVGDPKDASKGTDFYAIKNRFVSITPLSLCMTLSTAIDDLEHWMGSLSKSMS